MNGGGSRSNGRVQNVITVMTDGCLTIEAQSSEHDIVVRSEAKATTGNR